mmetsp:Transcript_39500/g.85243  ORF Transcript_39500/g.85243 Transcript_39500/m.85243 type:complete len:245 (+) Transcript_39500:1531-2265(+)
MFLSQLLLFDPLQLVGIRKLVEPRGVALELGIQCRTRPFGHDTVLKVLHLVTQQPGHLALSTLRMLQLHLRHVDQVLRAAMLLLLVGSQPAPQETVACRLAEAQESPHQQQSVGDGAKHAAGTTFQEALQARVEVQMLEAQQFQGATATSTNAQALAQARNFFSHNALHQSQEERRHFTHTAASRLAGTCGAPFAMRTVCCLRTPLVPGTGQTQALPKGLLNPQFGRRHAPSRASTQGGGLTRH